MLLSSLLASTRLLFFAEGTILFFALQISIFHFEIDSKLLLWSCFSFRLSSQ